MTLKTNLDAFRAEFLEKFPVDKAAIMQRATEQLAKDYATKPVLPVGDRAADFELPNAIGNQIKLSDRLQQGAVILTAIGWSQVMRSEP